MAKSLSELINAIIVSASEGKGGEYFSGTELMELVDDRNSARDALRSAREEYDRYRRSVYAIYGEVEGVHRTVGHAVDAWRGALHDKDRYREARDTALRETDMYKAAAYRLVEERDVARKWARNKALEEAASLLDTKASAHQQVGDALDDVSERIVACTLTDAADCIRRLKEVCSG